MKENKKQWGGRRPGAGRKPRQEPKSRPIWCGQISPEQRRFIVDALTPEERFEALWNAALEKTGQTDQK